MMVMMVVMVGDDELVSSLLFDAEATRGVVSDWRKENTDAMLNRSPKNKSASLLNPIQSISHQNVHAPGLVNRTITTAL